MPKKTSATKTKKVTASRTKSRQSVMTMPFLHHEQIEFHKNHPNAKMLITVFVALAIVALAMAVYRYGIQPTQAFSMVYGR